MPAEAEAPAATPTRPTTLTESEVTPGKAPATPAEVQEEIKTPAASAPARVQRSCQRSAIVPASAPANVRPVFSQLPSQGSFQHSSVQPKSQFQCLTLQGPGSSPAGGQVPVFDAPGSRFQSS